MSHPMLSTRAGWLNVNNPTAFNANPSPKDRIDNGLYDPHNWIVVRITASTSKRPIPTVISYRLPTPPGFNEAK